MIGKMFSHYKIIEELGRGGMGIVYKATDRCLLRAVALKVRHAHFSINKKKRQRLIHEVRSASTLNHPNICTVHDISQSKRTDIFSLGAVLYEILTGTTPFIGKDNIEIMQSILNDSPKPPSSFKNGCSSELENVILKALAKSPESRYVNASAITTDIKKCSAYQNKKQGWSKKMTIPIISSLIFLLIIGLSFIFKRSWFSDNEIAKQPTFRKMYTIGLASEYVEYPSFLPDGESISYTSTFGVSGERSNIWIRDLKSGKARIFIKERGIPWILVT